MKALGSLGLVFAGVFAFASAEVRAEDFYQGKRLSIIVGSSAGGDYDVHARLVARHLGKFIPGNPSVIIQPMLGAGGVVAANYVYGVAPKDGSVILTFPPPQVLLEVLGAIPEIVFKSERFNWLAVSSRPYVLLCVANVDAGVRTLDDAIKRKKPLVVGGTDALGGSVIYARAYKEVLGANFKIIPGYGGGQLLTAMLRREIDALCWPWDLVKQRVKPMMDDGTVVAFTQLGAEKDPALPHVENALDRATTHTNRAILEALLMGSTTLGIPYVAPPGVPTDRVRILRKAFMDAMRDSKLLEEAKRMDREINPIPGDEAQKLVAALRVLPAPIMEKLRKIVGLVP